MSIALLLLALVLCRSAETTTPKPPTAPVAVALTRAPDRGMALALLDSQFRTRATRRVGAVAGWAWRTDPPLLAVVEEDDEESGYRLCLLSGADLTPVALPVELARIAVDGPLGRCGVVRFAGASGDLLLVAGDLEHRAWCHTFDLSLLDPKQEPSRALRSGRGVDADIFGPLSIAGSIDGYTVAFVCHNDAAFWDIASGDSWFVPYAFRSHGIAWHAKPRYIGACTHAGRLVFATRLQGDVTIHSLAPSPDQPAPGLPVPTPDPRFIVGIHAFLLSTADDRVLAYALGGDFPERSVLQILDVGADGPGTTVDVPNATDFRVDPTGRVMVWNRFRGSAWVPVQPGLTEARPLGRLPATLEDLLVIGSL